MKAFQLYNLNDTIIIYALYRDSKLVHPIVCSDCKIIVRAL